VGTFPPATTDAYESSDKLQMIANTMDIQQSEGRLTFSAPENGMIHCEERAPWEMVTVKCFQKFCSHYMMFDKGQDTSARASPCITTTKEIEAHSNCQQEDLIFCTCFARSSRVQIIIEMNV
jgi:hypothetical protein